MKNVRTTEDVVWVAQEFLATWSGPRIEVLPVHCRPGRMSDADDVSLYALTLVQEQCKLEAQSPDLNSMANFFAAAASRISQILAQARRESSTSKLFSRS